MERRYRESEKKIHKSPYVDPGEAAVDLPQDIIRVGGDLVLLKRPVTWSYPDHPEYTGKWPPPSGGHYAGVGTRSGVNAGNYGSLAGAGGTGGAGASSRYGGYGGGGGGGGGSGSYGAFRSGSVGVGGGGGGGFQNVAAGIGNAGINSSYRKGPASTTGSEGYYSAMNSGGAYANNDYASPSGRNQQEYPISIKRSASQGDSTFSAFAPTVTDEYSYDSSTRRLGESLSSPQKYAGLNAFPVSPADTRLTTWAAAGSPASTPGGTTTTTTFKRLYQEKLSKRKTANGNITFDEVQQRENVESGRY